MKRARYLLLWLIIFNCYSAASQGTRLYNTQFDNRIALADCLAQLEKEFNLHFSYPSAISQQIINPPALRSTPSLETYLNELFLSIGFEYQIIDEEIIMLRPRLTNIESPSDAIIWRGKIIDQLTGEPIIYALINTSDQQAFTFTDEDGEFSLALRPNHSDDEIVVHALGYTDQFFNPSSGKLPEFINLNPTDLLLSQVTILENKPSRLLNGNNLEQRVFQKDWSSSAAGIYSQDIFREMQIVIPGITAHDDGNAGIQIRGGDDDETLIILDEIPIYRADHFYGIFGSINGDYIEEYAVYKNANPIEYGGKLSGMVDMQTGKASDKFSGKINVDLLSANGNLKIPFGKSAGLNVAGRRSYTNLTKNKSYELAENTKVGDNGLTRTSNLISQPDFDFWDSNAQLYFNLPKLHLEGNFYSSQDNYLNQYRTEFSFGHMNQFTLAKELFAHDIQWQNTGGSFLAEYKTGAWTLQGVGYTTNYKTANAFNSNLELSASTLNRIANFAADSKNSIQDYGQKLQIDYGFTKSSISFGMDAIQHQTALSIQSNNISAFDRMVDASELTGFAAWTWRPTKNWQLEFGNRLTHFEDENYYLPQLQLKYLAGKQGMLKGSLSRKAQFVREITFQDRLGQSTQYLLLSDQKVLPVGLAWNYMLGGALYFSKLTLDAELYLKNTQGDLAFSSRRIGINQSDVAPIVINDFKVFRGTGRVVGMDLALQYHNGPYNSSVAYTLSKSTNQFKEIYQNQAFASSLDSRHQFKWLNQYEWNRFGFFATYVFASGRPYTDISSLTQETLISDIDPNTLIKRLPNYHRIDLGLDYSFPIGKTEGSIGLSCFNLTDHLNVKYQQYIFAIPNGNQGEQNEVVGAQTLQLDRTFNLNFSLKF